MTANARGDDASNESSPFSFFSSAVQFVSEIGMMQFSELAIHYEGVRSPSACCALYPHPLFG